MHSLRSLTEKPFGYIGYCPCCKKYNLAYKNSLFILSEFEIDAFCEMMIDKVGFADFETTHGKQYMMKTPMNNYYILLTEPEIDEIIAMILEVGLIIDAHRLVNTNVN
jgi:hypothetical protein